MNDRSIHALCFSSSVHFVLCKRFYTNAIVLGDNSEIMSQSMLDTFAHNTVRLNIARFVHAVALNKSTDRALVPLNSSNGPVTRCNWFWGEPGASTM